MRRCLELAALGAGRVAPNPIVGALLVHEGRIIGEGYHQQYGGPHAEVNAVRNVQPADRHLIPASTIYVTLEPCAHHGKTPPCADLIINEGIRQVVIGCRDPFPEVAGKGIGKLEAAGIKVTLGVLEADCRLLNKRFFTFYEQQRPYIILKWAGSADGYIGKEGQEVVISGQMARRFTHRLRSEESGILVGTGTAVTDNPALNTRYWPGKDPVRMVIDRHHRIPATHHVLDGSRPTIIFSYSEGPAIPDLQWSILKPGADELQQVLAELYRQKILSVIVEGGRELHEAFITAGSWDEALVIRSGQVSLGEGITGPQLTNGIQYSSITLDTDTIDAYYHTGNHFFEKERN